MIENSIKTLETICLKGESGSTSVAFDLDLGFGNVRLRTPIKVSLNDDFFVSLQRLEFPKVEVRYQL